MASFDRSVEWELEAGTCTLSLSPEKVVLESQRGVEDIGL